MHKIFYVYEKRLTKICVRGERPINNCACVKRPFKKMHSLLQSQTLTHVHTYANTHLRIQQGFTNPPPTPPSLKSPLPCVCVVNQRDPPTFLLSPDCVAMREKVKINSQ